MKSTRDEVRGKGWGLLVARRVMQLGTLLLFVGSVRWGWSVAGAPLLNGNLSASEVVGLVPLADPFAVSQQLVSGHVVATRVLVGAGLVMVLYGLLFGRAFCSWVCPMNLVTDLAEALRRRFKMRDPLHVHRGARYVVLALSFLLSAVLGVAAFEWVSPIGMLHREVILGVGFGWVAVLGVFLLDLFVLRHGWCGHICPLGAFYSLLGGRLAQLKIGFAPDSCTRCGDCLVVCPESQVLKLDQSEKAGMVVSGECTQCGQCISVCPENTLYYDLRSRVVSSRGGTASVTHP